jgi:hypothetical protein
VVLHALSGKCGVLHYFLETIALIYIHWSFCDHCSMGILLCTLEDFLVYPDDYDAVNGAFVVAFYFAQHNV